MAKTPLAVLASLLIIVATGTPTRCEEHGGMMSQSSNDTRQPLPLLPMMAAHQKQNMREHLAAVQAIVAAIARDDMAGVAKASAGLGFTEAMGQMCEHMGAAAPGFTPMALNFHRTADTIGDAARSGDRQRVLSALDQTLQTCVGCHAAYRQEVVDEETWRRLTAPHATR